MSERKKKPRRYRVTERSGLTLKSFRPVTHHKKLPEICYIYTQKELQEFAKQRGMKVTKR